MASPTFLPGEPPPGSGQFPNNQFPQRKPQDPNKPPPQVDYGPGTANVSRQVGPAALGQAQALGQGPATRRRQEANAQRRAGLQGRNPNSQRGQLLNPGAQPPQVPPAQTQLAALQSTMTAPQQIPTQTPGLNTTYGLPPGARNFA